MSHAAIARLVVAAALCVSAPALAQSLELPDLSPRAEVMQMVGVTPITVNYASPGVKGRKIFGELVPNGELWRTGANSATTIEFGTDVQIAGSKVPAGKYAIFTIPGAAEWTVIINKNANQGGTRQYDQKLDQARVKVKPQALANARERMTFVFADTTDEGTRLDLEWAKTRVSLPITIATGDLVTGGIDAYGKQSARQLANAARYYKGKGQLDRALGLIDASLAIDGESWYALWIKADTLAAKGDTKAALPIAEKAYALGKKADYFFWEGQVADAIKKWKAQK